MTQSSTFCTVVSYALKETVMSKSVITPDAVLTKFEKTELMERALDLACRHFEDPTDDHIDGVFNRLAWNLLRGESDLGATTIH